MVKGPPKIWTIYFFGVPKSFLDFFFSVDLSNTWREHLVWSKKSGVELKKVVTERFASSTVFLSLLFSSEMAILYSPSDPGKEIRAGLAAKDWDGANYWAGLCVCTAIFFSVTALVANFTATAVFGSLSKENAPVVLRSTLGLYSAQLPSRLVTGAIYLFFGVVLFSWGIIMPNNFAIATIVLAVVIFMHVVNTFSSMGRVIMDSGAMSSVPILDAEEEEKLNPHELSDVLIKRVLLARKVQVPVQNQYKIDYQEVLKEVKEGNITSPLSPSELHRRASNFGLERGALGNATINLGKLMTDSMSSAGQAVGVAKNDTIPEHVVEEGEDVPEPDGDEQIREFERDAVVEDLGF